MEFFPVGVIFALLGGCPTILDLQQPMAFEGKLYGPSILVNRLPPRVGFPIYLGDRIPSPTYGLIGVFSTSTDLPFAGFYHEVELATIVAGHFSAGCDLQTSLVNSGPGARLIWRGAEKCLALRLDLIRGRIALMLESNLDLGD